MYTGSVNRDYKFLDGQDIVPVQLVAFSLATKFCLRICRRYLRYLGFLPNFCPAIRLFAFTLEIFTVLVLKTLATTFINFLLLIILFRSQIAELWFPCDRTIANDRRICNRLRSRSVCFHMMTDDRKICCDLRSYGNQASYKKTSGRSTQKVCE